MKHREKIKFIKDNIKYRSCTPDDIYIGNILEWMRNDKNFDMYKTIVWLSELERKKSEITCKATADYYRDELLEKWIFKSDPLEEQSEAYLDLIIEAIYI